jgi:hypothetical protein
MADTTQERRDLDKQIRELEDMRREFKLQKPADTPEARWYFKELEREIAYRKLLRQKMDDAQRAVVFAKGTKTERAKVSKDEVLALLADAAHNARSASLKRDAKCLLEMIEAKPDKFSVEYGVHKGGTGGSAGSADFTWHITICAGNGNFHLRLDNKRHLFHITPTPGGAKGQPKPWQGVGAQGVPRPRKPTRPR